MPTIDAPAEHACPMRLAHPIRWLFAALVVAALTAASGRRELLAAEPTSPAPTAARACRSTVLVGLLAPWTKWQTPIVLIQAESAGPTVLVLAGQHGDEPAGPLAADRIARWCPMRGTIVVVPRVNRPALAAGTRRMPSERHADLARNFPRSEGDEPRGLLARAVWELVTLARADLVLDLHEGFDVHRRTGKSVGSSVMYPPTAAGERFATAILGAVNATIADPGSHFDPIPKPIPGSVIHAAWRELATTGIVLETTKVAQPIELRVEQHLVMAGAALRELGMLPAADSEPPSVAFVSRGIRVPEAGVDTLAARGIVASCPLQP